MSIKVLVTDPISDKGLKLLKESKIEVLYEPDLDPNKYNYMSSDVDGWIIRSGTNISKDNILNSKKLQIIGRAGVGVDNIDIDSATSNGIVVMNVPDGNTVSAAEHTIAMMLSLSRNISSGHSSLSSGLWDRHKLTGSEVQGKTLGVVGLGKIGREVIKRALGYDMHIMGYDPYVNKQLFDLAELK